MSLASYQAALSRDKDMGIITLKKIFASLFINFFYLSILKIASAALSEGENLNSFPIF